MAGWAGAGYPQQSPGMCVPVCVCSAGGLSFYLWVPSGTRQACPCPAELALPGSSHCDSMQQQLTPNWFDESSEPARLAGARDHVQSQARAPVCLSSFSGTPRTSPASSFPRTLVADASMSLLPRALARPEAHLL